MTRAHIDLAAGVLLMRRYAVVIRNVSRTGGLIETDAPLAPGIVGLLSMRIGPERRTEMFRVCRAHGPTGDERAFAWGVEFLPVPWGSASLRHAVERLERVAREEDTTIADK